MRAGFSCSAPDLARACTGLTLDEAKSIVSLSLVRYRAIGRELRFRYTTLDYDRAINCFEKAIQLEPRSALAHAYLAMSAAARVQLVSDFRCSFRVGGSKRAGESEAWASGSPASATGGAGACRVSQERTEGPERC